MIARKSGAALIIGSNVLSPHGIPLDLIQVWTSPMLFFSMWLFLNCVVLLIGTAYFVIAERVGFVAWGVVAGLESLFVMLGWFNDLETVLSISVAWFSWLAILTMSAAGLWLCRQMLTNRWARQLAALHAENAARQAEMEHAERERIRREKER